MRSRKKLSLACAVVLACATLPGCTLLFPVEEEMLAPPLIEPAKIDFKTVTVTKSDIQNRLQVSAYFAPTVFSDVVFPYSGRLLALYAKEGLEVQKDDLLAEFDTENIESDLRDQRFVVEKARLNYEQKRDGQSGDNYIYSPVDGVIHELKAETGKDASVLTKTYNGLCAILPEARLRAVIEHVQHKVSVGQVVNVFYQGQAFAGSVVTVTGGAPSPGENIAYFWNGTVTIEVETDRIPHKGRVEVYGNVQSIDMPEHFTTVMLGQAEMEVSGLEYVAGTGIIEQVLVREGQTIRQGEPLVIMQKDTLAAENARIDYQMAQAKLDDLQLQYDRARVLAPLTGRVTWMGTFNINDWINSYTDLCRIADPDSVMLEYKGDKASQFLIGAKVTVTHKQKEYTAEVVANPSTIPREKNGSMVNAARFAIDGLDSGEMTYGESAMVVAILEEQKDVIVVPKNYVQSFYGRKYVNVLVDGDKVEKDVKIGIETATQVEIVEGITTDDLIIVQ